MALRLWHLPALAVLLLAGGFAAGKSTGSGVKTMTVVGPPIKHTITVTKKVPVVHVQYRTRVVTRTRTVREAPPEPSTGASDKDFAVQELQIKDDGLGDIGGIARVTNTGSAKLTAVFTFTLFQDGQTVGTAQGSADSVAPGQTVTVQLVSQDPMVEGSFRYTFQVDTEY